MKKYLQSSWMRVLSCFLCTISSIALVVSFLGFWIFAQIGGVYEIDTMVKEEIAETYALYAVDTVEIGEAEEVAEYFTERGIACSIVYVPNGGTAVEETIFQTGTLDEQSNYLVEMVPGAYMRYNEKSLLNVLMGMTYYESIYSHMEFPIQLMVFDSSTGIFYYETEIGYFEVEEIRVYEAGVYADYVLTKVDGQKCYYNGYFKTQLDTSQYEMWDDVIIEGLCLSFDETPKELTDGILVVEDSSAFQDAIRSGYYESNGDVILCEYGDYMDKYQIRISWNVEQATVDGTDSLFLQWDSLYGFLYQFDWNAIIGIIFNFILFILSAALFVCSAIGEKEHLGILHKAPVCIYSGVILTIEALLLVLLYEGIIDGMLYDGVGSVDSVLALAVLVIVVMVWIGFIYLQNIVTRIKCRSFWRTTEFYYIYELLKNSWNFLTKPVKWCWKIITAPFRAVADAWKEVMCLARKNTPLFLGGIIVFGIITIIEMIGVFSLRWYEDTLAIFFIFIKIIEATVLCLTLFQMQKLHEGSKRVASGDMSQPIDTRKMFWKFKEHGENINKVGEGIALAVEERMKSEHFKTELITNVSHDIKTPLTSIINYVDLIKKEDIQDEKVQEYVDVLDRQSARLKKLIEDLMEASKASTGNLAVNLEECDVEVLLTQVVGEFEEKLQNNQLAVVVDKPAYPIRMMADGRHMWRVLDNLLNNACKYSLPNTRVYVNLKKEANDVVITFKNISKVALNIPSDELMERFVRGDSSRNTEGSGLGLSIAQSLTELMNGTMKLEIDGDLFKVTLRFPTIK